MGKIAGFFGRRKGQSGQPPRDTEELVAPFSVPAVQLVDSTRKSQSFLGGAPRTGETIVWPSKNGKPLSFLASVHLPTLAVAHAFEWLPSEGCLLFFFDVNDQPWGFDPQDRGAWAVLHVPEGAEAPNPVPSCRVLPRRDVEFRRIRTVPSWERPEIQALALTNEESDRLCEIMEQSYGGAAAHQIGGYPDAIQGDQMELECQLVSNGIYCGDASGYRSAEAERLESGAEDWMLLLQMDSDDAIDLMWGDLGKLYFWIRKQDASAGRFDRVWTILQCS